MFWGDERAAAEKYALAYLIDSSNSMAPDRFALAAVRLHDPRLLHHAVLIIDSVINAFPSNDTLRMDLGLCQQSLGEYRDAARTFEEVGRRTRDARATMFAALDLKRLHQVSRARLLLRSALSYDGTFIPARRALGRSVAW